MAEDESLDPRIVRTRRDVGESVRQLLVEEGWDAITHQRVAEHSGYARNTIYRHFPDRTSLLLHAGTFQDAAVHSVPTGDVRADLVAETIMFRNLMFSGPLGVLLSVVFERAERDPEVEVMRRGVVEAGTEITRAALEAGRREGLIRTDVSVESQLAALCGPILYARMCVNHRPDDAEIERMVDALIKG